MSLADTPLSFSGCFFRVDDGLFLYLITTYDEFFTSYSDRSASIPAGLRNQMKEISARDVFRPIIVVNG
jgi:hypothetical protein